ncbi:MAG TPA: alkaline phosphatase family protein, partial [bacterium]|nr:alkaline phosphatase family protein [bacterium]
KTIQMLEDRKILQETLLVIVSDHGLSETTEHFDVGPWLEKEKKIKTLYHTNIFKRKFDAASMVSGNGMCHLYFKDDKGWSGRIPHEDFVKDTDLLAELVARPEVSLVITQAQDETIYFQNKKGCSHFSVDTTQNIIHYTFTQTDPLGIFNNKSINPEEGFTFDKSLELTWDSEYPDVFVQMHQLFRSHRTGDIVLSANSGYDFRNRFEVPLHKASHGALLPEHMKVPLLMNYPIEAQYIRSVDVFPTLLKLMGKAIPSGLDGRCLVG